MKGGGMAAADLTRYIYHLTLLGQEGDQQKYMPLEAPLVSRNKEGKAAWKKTKL
jgi:hypothetical protein